MPFRITTKRVLQLFTLDGERMTQGKKNLKASFLKAFLFTLGQMTAYINSSTVPMTQPNTNGN